MKTNIQEYTNFLHALQTDSIVYLFGTGISASLTGQSYSWWKWIMDGISHMKDRELANSLQQSLESDSTTENMIDVVGNVIMATKADCTYESWMQEAFETNPITNHPLAATLKKLLVLQDVFATTNYDLLLEHATGLGTLSYETPDKAFDMLDHKRSTDVLHIHGLYDSQRGLDNIIADQAQYAAILDDKGAQFIQHILGTRTLIFVGCGKTTEDANIAQFIQFAKMHLKMNRDYYFLYKEGNYPDGMPENIKPIPYGDEYSDLSSFLEDMAQIRIRGQIKQNPLIGRTPYQREHRMTDPLMRYHYSQEAVTFYGREKELEALTHFIHAENRSSWWAITGQAGSGKSRLALEFLKQLPTSWFGFFINDKSTVRDAETFTPFADTIAVIDYVSGREYRIAEIMRMLTQVFAATPYSLRILLIERENNRQADSWYGKLSRCFGRYSPLMDSEYKQEFLNLGDLDLDAVERFIGEVCAINGLEADSDRDSMLRKAYGNKFEKLTFRPLYVQIFVEAWIENDCILPRYDHFEELLTYLLEKEQERWLDALDGDQTCCNSFIHLLLRANISGSLSLDHLPAYYKNDWDTIQHFVSAHSFPGRQQREKIQALLHSICQNIEDDKQAIVPMFPDIIKEYMFYFYMDEERLPSVMNELWENAAHDFSVFITRCMTDFPENDFYKRALNEYEQSTANVEILLGRLELLKKWTVNPEDDPRVLLGIIDNEYAFWKTIVLPNENPEEVALLKLTGLNMVTKQYGGWTLYDASRMVEVIDEAWEIPGGDALKIMKQFFLQEHIKTLAQAGFSEDASYLQQKLEITIQENSDDDWNSLLNMQNRNVEMMNSLFKGNFQKGAKILQQMEQECLYSYVEAVRALAHSCFNIDQFSLDCNKQAYIGKGLATTQKLILLYPDDPVIKARHIACQLIGLQCQYFIKRTLSNTQLLEKLAQLELEVKTLEFHGEDSDEALGIAWGALKTLSLNALSTQEDAVKSIIREAADILKINPRLSDVVAARILAVHALHKSARKDKVSHEEVEELFQYVEVNFDSESVRGCFFNMLKDSEDARHADRYMTKWITTGAIQDATYNPLYGNEADAMDMGDAELLQMLANLSPQETYRREHKKIGANDPCPCGSGKKFKKCCRGSGRYD